MAGNSKREDKAGAGFTLVELLITTAIVIMVSIIGYLNLTGTRYNGDLKNTANNVMGLLREAQSRSMSQSQSTVWGVHFENSTSTSPFYALFYGLAYAATTTIGRYPLPGTVKYATSTLGQGSSTDVMFAQITGLPAASATIKFLSKLGTLASSTIMVNTNGEIQN